ncbi:MAG: ABC transporter ATP-binding protein [Spartobacteria bacterium]|nr:ABC transporter ATP-binding protein [Spartobacteria bacterium]
MGSNQDCIDIKDLKRTYVMGEVEVPVLRGVNACIPRGELSVILGASGSGKSTLLNMIGGIDRPSSGIMDVFGMDISDYDDDQLTTYRRDNVGFVFQFYNLVPTLTAKENVEVSTEIARDPMDAAEALKLVGLGDRIDYFPAQMSGGQQQRVAIARALAKNPKLMLCDEPTGALDHETSIQVLSLLQKLNKELQTTIVMITHAQPIAQMANHVLHLQDGVILKTDDNKQPKSPSEIVW